jgi:soluble lytic murein transglycosylase-like protein
VDDLLLLGGIALIVYALYYTSSGSILESGEESIMAAVEGWQNVNEGPTWVPVINQSEVAYGIPTNLLARQAYAESRFRADVITGETPSTAGALGILQLMPAYFTSVQVPPPFSASDTQAQITQAAQYMQSLYSQFKDWGLALAAYNAGPTTVANYLAGTGTLPTATQAYVAQILTDVPEPSVLTA